jgi:hypothetical protein
MASCGECDAKVRSRPPTGLSRTTQKYDASPDLPLSLQHLSFPVLRPLKASTLLSKNLHVGGGEGSHADAVDEPRALDGREGRFPCRLALPSPRVLGHDALWHAAVAVAVVPAAAVDGVVVRSVPEALKLRCARPRSDKDTEIIGPAGTGWRLRGRHIECNNNQQALGRQPTARPLMWDLMQVTSILPPATWREPYAPS